VDEVQTFVSAMTKAIALHGMPNVYEGTSYILAQNLAVLEASRVVIVYRALDAHGAPTVRRKCFALHTETQAFGYAFQACGTPQCAGHTSSFHLRPQSNRGKVRLRCAVCDWVSGWVSLQQPMHFEVPQPELAPHMYAYEFPATDALKGLFVNAPKGPMGASTKKRKFK
jgi:hypothetical protein